MDAPHVTGVNWRRLWWLASYPKSGNTWARMVVDAYVSGGAPEINNLFRRYVVGDLLPAMYHAVSPVPLYMVGRYGIHMIRNAALLQYLAHAAGDACLKTHHAKLLIDGVPLIPPNLSLGAVYIARDPRDIVISWAKHSNITIDKAIEFMGEWHSEIGDGSGLYHCATTWSNHVKSWTQDNEDIDTAVVRYEDMHTEPERVFRDILNGLGFTTLDEDRFKMAVEQASFSKLREQEEAGGFNEKRGGEHFFREGKKEGWKGVLSDEQEKKIVEDHGEVMELLKYI